MCSSGTQKSGCLDFGASTFAARSATVGSRPCRRPLNRTTGPSTTLLSAERVESRSSSELSGLGFASASRSGRQQPCSRTAPMASVLSCVCIGTGSSTTLSINCGKALDRVLRASQQARLLLNQGIALVEPSLSSELSGWSVLGVASQLVHQRFGR